MAEGIVRAGEGILRQLRRTSEEREKLTRGNQSLEGLNMLRAKLEAANRSSLITTVDRNSSYSD